MKRRDSLKFISVGSLTAGAFLSGCKTDDKQVGADVAAVNDELNTVGRQDFEIERDKKLVADRFFTADEMSTVTILADIIIPKDEKSGSATEAGVPDFIEFIVKDLPEHQLPLRGGLRWLDLQCLNRFGNAFKDCTKEQQLLMVDDIAYPNKAKPEMQQGVAFFNRMRNLTATGFYTTEIGIADLGYMGNMANDWKGVPEEELEKYGLKGI